MNSAPVTMRSVVCEAPGQVRLVERSQPTPGHDEVMLRVRRVGVSRTDLRLVGGAQRPPRYPHVIGRELSGTVVSAPTGSGLLPGHEVYVLPYMACGRCPSCEGRRPQHCQRIEELGIHRDGALSDFLAVPAPSVFRTQGISLDDAAMLPSLASGAYAVRRSGLRAGQRMLVVGTGPASLAAAMFARLAGAEVTVLEAAAERATYCRDVLGLVCVDAGEDAMATLWRRTGGHWFDVVVDASGDPATIEQAIEWVACSGTYVLAAPYAGRAHFSEFAFHAREMTVLANRNPTEADFGAAIAAIKAGQVSTRVLNTHRATLSSVAAVLPQWMNSNGMIKAIVEV